MARLTDGTDYAFAQAHYAPEKLWEFFDGDRDWVRSVGVAMRVNALGFAVVEIDYVRPLDRPGRGWL